MFQLYFGKKVNRIKKLLFRIMVRDMNLIPMPCSFSRKSDSGYISNILFCATAQTQCVKPSVVSKSKLFLVRLKFEKLQYCKR